MACACIKERERDESGKKGCMGGSGQLAQGGALYACTYAYRVHFTRPGSVKQIIMAHITQISLSDSLAAHTA